VAKTQPKFEDFLEGLRTDGTRTNYRYGITWVLGDQPDEFITLAKKSRHSAEDRLITFIRKNRDRVASATLVNPIMAVKSLLEYHEVLLNWKKVRRELPAHQKVADDRAPTPEEIRKLLNVCELRMRVVVLVMSSSGIRVGSFESLKLKHVKFLPNGTAQLAVYDHTPDKYLTFITPEAVLAVKQYLTARENAGEKLTPESTLIRDKWDFEERVRKIKHSTIAPDIATPMTPKAIRNRLGVLWVKAGIRAWGIHRGEFQQAHGFRKFFKVQASRGIERSEIVEALMGHKTNYFKPEPDELEAEYSKAVPHLSIGEEYRLKEQFDEEKKRLRTEFEDRLKSIEDEIRYWKIHGSVAAPPQLRPPASVGPS
jgi:site-specific recombinase XerD